MGAKIGNIWRKTGIGEKTLFLPHTKTFSNEETLSHHPVKPRAVFFLHEEG
jgi:hypothetical protein